MIFIIDDDREDFELISSAYQEVNPKEELQFFENGTELISHIKANKNTGPFPSYIVTDLKMPAMDGVRLVELLRNNTKYNLVPVIMLFDFRFTS